MLSFVFVPLAFATSNSAAESLVVGCSNATDCTAEVQAALDQADGRRLIFRGEYTVQPLFMHGTRDAVLQFEAGSTLLARRGFFHGQVSTIAVSHKTATARMPGQTRGQLFEASRRARDRVTLY